MDHAAPPPPALPTQPEEADFARRVRDSFARQGAMRAIGAAIARVAAGKVEIALPFGDGVAQQHGFFHGGIVSALLDSACGYAALSLMPADAAVLTVEFKISFLAPARGALLLARGRVVKPGRTLSFCEGEAVLPGPDGGPDERRVATMSATMICVRDRPDLRG